MTETDRMTRLCAELKSLLIARLRLRDVAPEQIADDDSLVGGALGLDSIDMLELALAVEERYGVKITDEHLAQAAFQTIKALAAYIQTQGGAPADPGPAS
jgi:acyl carrier protein